MKTPSMARDTNRCLFWNLLQVLNWNIFRITLVTKWADFYPNCLEFICYIRPKFSLKRIYFIFLRVKKLNNKIYLRKYKIGY